MLDREIFTNYINSKSTDSMKTIYCNKNILQQIFVFYHFTKYLFLLLDYCIFYLKYQSMWAERSGERAGSGAYEI